MTNVYFRLIICSPLVFHAPSWSSLCSPLVLLLALHSAPWLSSSWLSLIHSSTMFSSQLALCPLSLTSWIPLMFSPLHMPSSAPPPCSPSSFPPPPCSPPSCSPHPDSPLSLFPLPSCSHEWYETLEYLITHTHMYTTRTHTHTYVQYGHTWYY